MTPSHPEASMPAPTLGNPSLGGGEVEAQFRAWYYTGRAQRAQTSRSLAQLRVFASGGIGRLGSGITPQEWPAAIKLLLITPLRMAPQRVSREPKWRRYFPHFMCASII